MRMMEVWAHRGASGYMPENTLESFELAVQQGADGIELDVHLSSDGKMVVIHDEELKRVTGVDGFVKDLTLQQLKKLEIHTPEGPEGIYRIPTLAEVLDLIRPTGLKVNIELKNSIFLYEGLEEKVTALVADLGMKDRIVYSSFNHYSMRKIKTLVPDAKTGLLICDGFIDMAEYAKRVGADYIHPAVYHLWYPGFVQAAKEKGLPLHVWTANEPEHLALVKAAEAEAVITNYPDRAIAFMSAEKNI